MEILHGHCCENLKFHIVIHVPLHQMSAMAKKYRCSDYTADFSHTTAFPFLKSSTVNVKGHLHPCIGKT
jgi:hypothetical protein